MNESTSILDLPTDPLGGGSISNNISINANESNILPQQLNHSSAPNLSLDQTTINQIVSGIQQASISGATLLPSRDIPMSTTNFSNDPQAQPNYIPAFTPQTNVDYIKNFEEPSDMIDSYNKNSNRQDSLDDMYNEIQSPLLLAVLYFLFQLPFFKKMLYSYLPMLFSNDGNLNINGFIFTSILFGIIFYIFNKVTNNFNAF